MSEQLPSDPKACPFCGKPITLHQGQGDITYFCCNVGCGAIMSFRPNLKGVAAIKKYNERVST